MMKKIGYIVMLLMSLLLVSGCAKQDTAQMATINDVENKRIGVYTGTIYDKFAVQRFPSATVMQYNGQADLILALKSGKVDVVITNLYAAKDMMKTNDDVGILTDDVLNFPVGIGFNKNNPVLREKFNAFLKASQADGSANLIYKKWFENDIETIKMPDFQPNLAGEKVVLGVAVGDLPSVGYVNGKYVGLDIELVQAFAQKENMNLEIISSEFGGLIASLSAGKMDMIADCIAITPERQKQVDFSDPYMEDKSAILALKKNLVNAVQKDEKKEQAPSLFKSVSDSFYSNLIHENRYLLVIDGLQTTGIISVFSILFGTLLGALICYMRMSNRKVLTVFAQLYISILRGVPVLVLLMVIYYVIFAKTNMSPIFVAVIAFGMNFAAYVSEMFRTAIESIDKGQNEAGIAGGFTRVQTFMYIVMPQAIRQVIPVYTGELISLVKMTSIVGYVAVQDLTKASDIIRSRTFDAFFPLIMTAVLYFAISWLLVLLLDIVEEKTDPKQRRRESGKHAYFSRAVMVIAVVLIGAGVFKVVGTPTISPRNDDKNQQITKLSELDGKRIAVITGTTGDFVVREKYQKAQVLDMLYPADGALAVKSNKADAFVFDKSTLQYITARSNGEFEMIPEKLSSVEIAIPMRPNDNVLHQKINDGITKLKNDGTLDEMYRRWFLEQSTTPTMPKITLDGKNGTIKMGTCLLAEPFAFVSNGEMVGHDIELAYRLAEILGVQLEITDMSYDAMIAALATGKIDIAIANFYKLEEREKIFEFSIPYLQNDISALVRRKN